MPDNIEEPGRRSVVTVGGQPINLRGGSAPSAPGGSAGSDLHVEFGARPLQEPKTSRLTIRRRNQLIAMALTLIGVGVVLGVIALTKWQQRKRVS